MAAQPVVLKALAKITFDLLYSNRRPENGRELFDRLVANLADIQFEHANPMWRYYEMSEEERLDPEIEGLADFLPDGGLITPESNRDLGAFQSGIMRFGAKHNDIYPILGDIIRWKMNLPNRHLTGEGIESDSKSHGFPADGTSCRFTYGGKDYNGKIANGLLVVEGFGEGFKSFSAASHAVTQTSRNGWLDWYLQDLTGTWVLADEWRNQGT